MSLYYYEFQWDSKYCYPNSYVLKNKLNIRNNKDLEEAERNITAHRILQVRQNPFEEPLDFNYLCKLHKHIFQDIYTWAGKTRDVNIAKGNVFCPAENIKAMADEIFSKLKKENFLLECKEQEMPRRLSYYLSEINTMHPFREGNGRTQRLFIEILAERAAYEVDFSKVTQHEMLEASAEAFMCRYDSMNKLFLNITKKL